ncbi:MAG TPA: hypothetical protein PLF13_10195 [candidate division Zixibacteria bacterium]|nr:hypothetical protein [candidate division Zixibacteria bacterium]
MECYFGSLDLPEGNDTHKSAVVAFQIPQIGIKFKAPFAAVDSDHGDLASLLALLEFIDSNQKYFSNHTYQIFGNNLHIVNILNGREQAPAKFAGLVARADEYRERYRFSLDWVPSGDNPALDESLFD